MRRQRTPRSISALGLGLGLVLVGADPTSAQSPSISSGSGSGTGTGMSAGSFNSTGTGRESGGLGSTGTGMEGMSSTPLSPGRLPFPGLTRPIDRPPLAPGERLAGPSTVPEQLFVDARAVSDPGERAMALIRIAQAAIFSNQFDEAHKALFEAGPASLQEPGRLVREQRTVATVDALLSLAEERMRDIALPAPPIDLITPPDTPGSSPIPPETPVPALPSEDRRAILDVAMGEWAEALRLASGLENPTARSESLYRCAESQAFSSQRLITDPIRLIGGRPDPSKLSPPMREYTDRLLVQSAKTALSIDRPIWRDAAAFTIVVNAAASSQFPRGFQIARGIKQPEARTNALIRLAEGQALNGRPNEATAAYNEAALSVALIPQDDIRETLVGVLVDSLISYGRFDDARAAVTIYAVPARRLVALSAIAQSQGRRGLADSARQWIAREAPPEYRAQLYRRVNDGVLASIEQNRSKDLSNAGQ